MGTTDMWFKLVAPYYSHLWRQHPRSSAERLAVSLLLIFSYINCRHISYQIETDSIVSTNSDIQSHINCTNYASLHVLLAVRVGISLIKTYTGLHQINITKLVECYMITQNMLERYTCYQGPLLLTCLTLIPACVSYHIHSKLWDEITYPFLNFNGCAVEI